METPQFITEWYGALLSRREKELLYKDGTKNAGLCSSLQPGDQVQVVIRTYAEPLIVNGQVIKKDNGEIFVQYFLNNYHGILICETPYLVSSWKIGWIRL